MARPSQMAFSLWLEGKWSQKVAPFYENVIKSRAPRHQMATPSDATN